MEIIYIIIAVILWIFFGVTAYHMAINKLKWRDNGVTGIGSIFIAPIFFLVTILFYFYEKEWNFPKFFNKKTPIIDGYKWWDKVKIWMLDWIFVWESDYWNKYKILLQWEQQVQYYDIDKVTPNIKWEMVEELKLFKEAQELERKWKEFIAQAEKVRKQQKKVRNIMD